MLMRSVVVVEIVFLVSNDGFVNGLINQSGNKNLIIEGLLIALMLPF